MFDSKQKEHNGTRKNQLETLNLCLQLDDFINKAYVGSSDLSACRETAGEESCLSLLSNLKNNVQIYEFKPLNRKNGNTASNVKRSDFVVTANQGDLARTESKNRLVKETMSGDGRTALTTLKGVVKTLSKRNCKKHHTKKPNCLACSSHCVI